MKKLSIISILAIIPAIFILSGCNANEAKENESKSDTTLVASTANGGFENQVKWGEHLVTVIGCNDCHTPKKMTPGGPVPDESLALSGHPAKMPAPDVDRKAMESKGLIVTNDLTVWVGPWGISYVPNITSDATGIGKWTEDQFILCLRKGKWMGLETARDLLPPMPWQEFQHLTDGELKAIFAYLKSTKPIENVVPDAAPPVLARK